jgi:hypothetical protein
MKDDSKNKLVKSLILNLSEIFDDKKFSFPRKEILLRRSFTESWFSDTLGWLLDPKGSHGFGVKFANEFLVKIAKERSSVENKDKYARRTTYLKHGQSGKGQLSRSFSVRNSSSVRELYLPDFSSGKKKQRGRFCDVALLDLDIKDGLVVIIENKLFTNNHSGQLTDTLILANDKFKKARVREFVYLTLDGAEPVPPSGNEDFRDWVRLSWCVSVKGILDNLSLKSIHNEVDDLRNLLSWIQQLKLLEVKEAKSGTQIHAQMKDFFLSSTAEYILEELNRLGSGKVGVWETKKENINSFRLTHTSAPKRILYVELLKNFTITIYSKKSSGSDKIIIPFGTHPDQHYNLMDIAAREIYYKHFGDSVHRYLSKKRRPSSKVSKGKRQDEILFSFIHKYQCELKVMFAAKDFIK